MTGPRRLAPLLALVVVAWPAVGRAQGGGDGAQLEARHREAEAACSSGRLEEGVRILAELFAQTDDGNYIFNQGRCYQKNGHHAEALARFQMYLRRSDADPAAATRARQLILELQGLPAAPAPSPAASAPPPTGLAPPAGRAEAAEGSPPELGARLEVPSIGRTLRVAGLVTTGAGLAALGVATYFGMQTTWLEEDGRELARRTAPDLGAIESLNQRGHRAFLLQWVFLGVGATAVSTGALLYYLGVRAAASPDRSTVQVAPLPVRAGGGLLLRLTY